MARIADFVKVKLLQILQWMMTWKSPRPRRFQLAGQFPYCYDHVGVACLLCTPELHMRVAVRDVRIVCSESSPNSETSSPFSSHPYPWSSSTSGDLLGTESGVHLTRDLSPPDREKRVVVGRPMPKKVHVAKKRDIPPCISILPNYIGLLPSISKCQAVADGNYLKAMRKNGSLILYRVMVNKWLDGKLIDDNNKEEEDEEEEEEAIFAMD